MEDQFDAAKEYQERGFNVVLFNYRGVGNSTGKAVKAEDLIDDGKSVVNALLDEGFKIGEITLKPEAKNVLLDGSSIGGAVATAVGAEHPEMALAANRTFTRLTDTAAAIVKTSSNPLFAKLVKHILTQTTDLAKFDNIENMNNRLDSPHHSFTVIETARLGEGDDVLPRGAKLEQGIYAHSKANFQQLNEDVNHNSYLNLNERPVLLEKLKSLNKENQYDLLFRLHAVHQVFSKDATDLNLYITTKLKNLKDACEELKKTHNETSTPQYSELVIQQALKLKKFVESGKHSDVNKENFNTFFKAYFSST